MIVAILALLEGPFGRIIMYAVGALFIAGSATGGYFIWKHNVQTAALAKYNAQQLTEAKKQNDLFQEKLKNIETNQKVIVDKVTAQNEKLDKQSQDINDWLDLPEIEKKDRPASEILKEVIRRMQK